MLQNLSIGILVIGSLALGSCAPAVQTVTCAGKAVNSRCYHACRNPGNVCTNNNLTGCYCIGIAKVCGLGAIGEQIVEQFKKCPRTVAN